VRGRCQERKQKLDLQSVDITSTTANAPSLPMKRAFRTIRSYILWQHERGTLHYDIMVTLILVFVFFSPRVINFKDKPAHVNRHPNSVVVTSDGAGEWVYQIDASAISAGDESLLRDQFLHVIEPISGEVSIVKYEPILDNNGRVQEYRVWVSRKQ
jgi:hypothetical protein